MTWLFAPAGAFLLRDAIRAWATLVAIAFVAAAAAPSPASASVSYVTEWGSLGPGDGQFGGPVDLAAAGDGTVYVSDLFNGQSPSIQSFTTTGDFLRRWGSAGLGNGQFSTPGGIAVGPSGDIYVGDHSLNRIQRFSADGTFLGQWGTAGSGEGQFTAPWGLATDRRGRVYVVDYGNNRVQKFAADGAFLGQWGSFGSRKGQFLSPSFVATDSRNRVYVADSGNSRVQKFSSNGKHLGQWDTPGVRGEAPDYPLGIATGANDDVYVVGTSSVQKYNARGRLLTRWGKFGKGEGRFRNPQGIAADSAGNVYVGDSGNSRVQKFHDSGPPYPNGGKAKPGSRRPASTPKPPRIPRSFSARGRYQVPDLGIDVPFRYRGSKGDSIMVAGGRDHPIWFKNIIYGKPGEDKRLYTVTYRWPGVAQAVPCGAIPGSFSRRTLNAWLARSSFVGRETLTGKRRRHVNHWRVTGTLPALPPGNFVRLPIALGDIYVDRQNPAKIWKVLHFGVQNLYDPELDEWFELEGFSKRPGKVTLPRGCEGG